VSLQCLVSHLHSLSANLGSFTKFFIKFGVTHTVKTTLISSGQPDRCSKGVGQGHQDLPVLRSTVAALLLLLVMTAVARIAGINLGVGIIIMETQQMSV
jgi:hypothetical protein